MTHGHLISTDLLPALDDAMAAAVRMGQLYRARLLELKAMEAGESVSDGLTLLASVEGEAQARYDTCQAVIACHGAYLDSLRRCQAIAQNVVRPAGRDLHLVSAAAGQ